jgi:hypothetical protein
MILQTYTLIHVLIGLIGILSGLVVLSGLLTGKPCSGWTLVFLIATVLTSVTGFFFPSHGVLPSHIAGVISLIVLAAAIYARYVRRLNGIWRKIYVISAMLALYLNVFVAIVQAFLKIPVLKAMAPTQTEPPFKITQLVVLVLFVGLAIVASIRFRDKPASLA